jgi:asparagine synthase (glutamine-hydrolysing)
LVREVRFPYLDRDFLSFMYAIPRQQVVRVGQDRFLMKSALVGIVPDELLNRKQKAFVPLESEREKGKNRSVEMLAAAEIGEHPVSGSMGIIDPCRFSEALQKVSHQGEASMRMLKRTLRLEFWLRHLARHQILATPKATDSQDDSLRAREVALAPPHESSAS